MATRVKAKPSDLYERDLYAWSEEQAALLRARRFAELDLKHLILEIEDVGGSLYREVRSRVRTVIQHLLKLQHSPSTDPRSGWERTILTARADLAEDLTPTLRPRVKRNLARFYETARIQAGGAARSWRACGRRRPARDLPLQPGSDHRRLAAVTPSCRRSWRGKYSGARCAKKSHDRGARPALLPDRHRAPRRPAVDA